jgi:hypothetical protein
MKPLSVRAKATDSQKRATETGRYTSVFQAVSAAISLFVFLLAFGVWALAATDAVLIWRLP